MSQFWPAFDESHIKEFLESSEGEPQSTRPINIAAAESAAAKITAFLDNVHALPAIDYPCADAYIAFEKERLATLEMVLHNGDSSHTARLNDELFAPLAEIQQPEALGYLKQYIQNLAPQSPAAAQGRETVLSFWNEVAQDSSIVKRFKTIEHYRQGLRPYLENRFSFVTDLMAARTTDAKLTSAAVRDLLIQVIPQMLPEAGSGWTALVQEEAPNVFIDYERRAVVIPAGRTYAEDHIVMLIVHEIGVHVLRSVNGENSHERLAAYGLAGYGPAEEAFGVLLSSASKVHYQQIYSLVPFAVIDFATRAHPSSFRRVHELTTALLTCLANPDAVTFDEKQSQYHRMAFSRTIRTLRLGTTALIERSNTKYWRGLLLLVEYFDTRGLSQNTFDEFFIGKYDCLRADQAHLITHHD